jgi:GntR family transcriptional regulator
MSTAEPYYREIADEITEQIKSGKLAPGTKLPSTSELAASYGVSLGTAYRAVKELHDRDLVIGRRGLGVFVRRL